VKRAMWADLVDAPVPTPAAPRRRIGSFHPPALTAPLSAAYWPIDSAAEGDEDDPEQRKRDAELPETGQVLAED
jgi:hypothetical protein